eukprot:CAMPEP_0179840686 /NCGR_PEP_ID=MMETSP0982-20121206/2073_1 /TAXON_ID=483367 /ORGANISM="non described non described, Strain CCMP 2436" /LENGTH=142 /DNA_ID=CAMNT_0021724603 /DNA_START=128 /DNA_END=558 /DNA_ORIENTATION=+
MKVRAGELKAVLDRGVLLEEGHQVAHSLDAAPQIVVQPVAHVFQLGIRKLGDGLSQRHCSTVVVVVHADFIPLPRLTRGQIAALVRFHEEDVMGYAKHVPEQAGEREVLVAPGGPQFLNGEGLKDAGSGRARRISSTSSVGE